MALQKIEYRGWTIEIPKPSRRFKAAIWRPGARVSEPFHEEADSRRGIEELAKKYIDGILGPE